MLLAALQRVDSQAPELGEVIDVLEHSELENLLNLLDSTSLTAAHAAAGGNKAAGNYVRHRDRMNAKSKSESSASREIGPIPPVKDPERKEACRRNLRLYYESYFPNTFRLKWSKDHLRLIAKIQTAVLVGSLQAFAMSRGTGKSVKCERAILWSASYGHHLFQMLLCANEKLSLKSLTKLQLELELNQRLAEDFPEICYPIHCLERVAQRAKGQLHEGKPTFLQWSGDQLLLPVIPGSLASGSAICVAGLQEAVRGMSLYHTPTGGIIRPTLIIVDDPQTRESARSEDEIAKRLQIITSDMMGMVGPGEDLSVLVPCTVIEPGDVAATLLDREKHPEFRGETCRLLNTMPENMELWYEYDAIRRRCLKDSEPDEEQHWSDDAEAPAQLSNAEIYQEAIEFYLKHQVEMDKGAAASWPERKKKHEPSAILHGMNLFLQDPAMFWTEYQNDPAAAFDTDDEILTAEEIARKYSGYAQLQIPDGCQFVTGHIDMHKRILFYTLAAWTPGFDGYIIDYGTFPKQRHGYFTERTARPTLQSVFPGIGIEGALHAGLEHLCNLLFKRKLVRDDGAKMPINLLLIDSAWKPDIPFRYCATSPYEGRVAPSLGRKIGQDQPLLSRCKPKKGELIGLEWTIPPSTGREVRQIQFDAWWWKSFFHRRLATKKGDRGCVEIFGEVKHGRPSEDHDFYADHLASQFSTPLTGKRTIDYWRLKPGKSQDHYLDNGVACAVAASVLGAMIVGAPAELRPKQHEKRKITYLDRAA